MIHMRPLAEYEHVEGRRLCIIAANRREAEYWRREVQEQLQRSLGPRDWTHVTDGRHLRGYSNVALLHTPDWSERMSLGQLGGVTEALYFLRGRGDVDEFFAEEHP